MLYEGKDTRTFPELNSAISVTAHARKSHTERSLLLGSFLAIRRTNRRIGDFPHGNPRTSVDSLLDIPGGIHIAISSITVVILPIPMNATYLAT